MTNGSDWLTKLLTDSCNSWIGRVGDKQIINLAGGCVHEFGEVQHEVMHALGFYHEQSRIDRDNYITVNFQNIPRSMVKLLRSCNSVAVDITRIQGDTPKVIKVL